MLSDDDDEVHVDYSDDDIDSIEQEAFKRLEGNQITVENADGTLRCPFSPSRKKQSYPYKDLLQHAEGVAKGKRGAEAAGQHSALVKYLRTRLSGKASAPVERVHKLKLVAPKRKEDKDLFVYPWSGVVYNMGNSQRGADGRTAGIGNSEFKDFFQVFNPERPHVCWNTQGHAGMGVLTFRGDLEGLKDAQAFEKWFIENGYGRRDWEIHHKGNNLENKLYGWLARKEDYEGRNELPNDSLVSTYLRMSGDLKDIAMLGQEMNKMHEQRIQNLKETVYAKNEEYEILRHEVEVARWKAEEDMLQQEARHKKELEKVKLAAQVSAEEHARVTHEQHRKLQRRMGLLQRKCHELEEKERESQVDKTRLEQEKKENQQQLDIINRQSEVHKKHQADQVKLIKKHEEESKKLAELMQNMTLRLATQQQSELASQRLGEMKDSKKFAELTESFECLELIEHEHNKNTKELEDRIKQMEKEKAAIQEELQSLNEDVEMGQGTIQTLSNKERLANAELQEAREIALKVGKFGKEHGICVRRMGEINDEPWKRECQRLYKKSKDGWDVIFRTKYSIWEDKVKDPDFHAFKTVQVGNEDTWQRVLDDNNKDLLALKEELGREVMQTVVTALEEIEEYNPSGRYPTPVVWNSRANKRAMLSEIIQILIQAAQEGAKRKTGVKKRRLAVG